VHRKPCLFDNPVAPDIDGMKANAAETMPQEIMIRAIQNPCADPLEKRGWKATSNRKYAMKNNPAPNPNAASLKTERPGSYEAWRSRR